MAALRGQELVDWVLRQLTLLGTLNDTTLAAAVLDDRIDDGRTPTLVREATRALASGTPAVVALVDDCRPRPYLLSMRDALSALTGLR